MVNIVALEHPDNVTLIGGAMQYWVDQQESTDWSSVLLPQVAGRTLVIGTLPPVTLEAIAGKATSLDVIVRGIPDAATVGEAFPSVQVWCGDVRSLRQRVEPYDTVISLVDASTILSLESEPRTWMETNDDVLSLAKQDATVVAWVENDLGVHRLTQSHNPRAENSDKDWNVMATWDTSRPRTLQQVTDSFPDASVLLTYPSDRPWTLLVDADRIDPFLHAALTARAAITPTAGPDPVYMLNSAAQARRLAEFATGWLVTIRPRTSGGDVAAHLAVGSDVVTFDSAASLAGRPALYVFAELAAAEDVAGIRRFLADWGRHFSGDAAGKLDHDPSFGHCTAEEVDGVWRFTPFVPRACTTEERWVALGELTGFIRGRAWRAPWPATFTDARILNHMGIMAGMHTVSVPKANSLVPQVSKADAWGKQDKQSLVAAIDRNDEAIRALRSQVQILEGRLKSAQGPASTGASAARIGRRAIGRVKRTLSKLRG